jgi:hypothetical protein
MRGKSRWISAAVALCAVLGANAASHAASIVYGNFGPNIAGLTFNGVTESSGTDPVPLFGPPTLTPAGLHFTPQSFVSSSGGGAVDITDGQLNFAIKGSAPIASFQIAEAGDYTLTGVGTAATSVSAGVIVRITVTEVGGVAVVPFALPPSNASMSANLASNPGLVQPWSLGITQVLPANVTGANVVIDNQLNTISQSSSIAFIAKKDFTVIITNSPEPTTLAAGALMVVFFRRRR